MYQKWPFFREMIDLIAMTLSKTDSSVSTNYENQLIGASNVELTEVGVDIRRRLVETTEGILRVTGCSDLYSGFQLLKRSMKVRNPYVDPLNVLQAEIMKRLRAETSKADNADKAEKDAETRVKLEDSFIVSVNGIAQGMKNSG